VFPVRQKLNFTLFRRTSFLEEIINVGNLYFSLKLTIYTYHMVCFYKFTSRRDLTWSAIFISTSLDHWGWLTTSKHLPVNWKKKNYFCAKSGWTWAQELVLIIFTVNMNSIKNADYIINFLCLRFYKTIVELWTWFVHGAYKAQLNIYFYSALHNYQYWKQCFAVDFHFLIENERCNYHYNQHYDLVCLRICLNLIIRISG
jgi:hypothetical protein